MIKPDHLQQRWPMPDRPKPIIFIGGGGIVNDAHIPAYRQGNLELSGIFDLNRKTAEATADRWSIPRVFDSLQEAADVEGVIFDVAIPPEPISETLLVLPEGATVLIQKPMGVDLAGATRIRQVCRGKNMTAAINFQLRFCPAMLALRDLIGRNALGRLVECEVSLNVAMPWHLWPFLEQLERMEINLHSIHYFDFIRSILGEPRGVYARTVKHPAAPKLASSRTTAILDYDDDVRCCLSTNHHHTFGLDHQRSQIRIEGEQGAAIVSMGVNLNYPDGEPDWLQVAFDGGSWQSVPLIGNWFPEAFLGTMCNLQRFAANEDDTLYTSVEDAWHTMALLEACYESDARGATPLPEDPDPRT